MRSLFRNKSTIIQFSPIRSGSTLVFNFLREIFPEKRIIKTHRLSKWQEKTATLVCTYRNPLDCISSNLLFLEKTPSEAHIEEQIGLLKSNGLEQLSKILDRKNMVLLKYEDFYHDHSVIFTHLEKFFKITLSHELKRSISEKYQVNTVKEKYTSKFDNAFEFDKENHWHGNHISEFNGQPNAATEVFRENQIQMIQTELQGYMELFGYKSTNR